MGSRVSEPTVRSEDYGQTQSTCQPDYHEPPDTMLSFCLPQIRTSRGCFVSMCRKVSVPSVLSVSNYSLSSFYSVLVGPSSPTVLPCILCSLGGSLKVMPLCCIRRRLSRPFVRSDRRLLRFEANQYVCYTFATSSPEIDRWALDVRHDQIVKLLDWAIAVLRAGLRDGMHKF